MLFRSEAPSRPARGSCFAQKQSVACPSVEATEETAVGEGCHQVAWYVNKRSFVMKRKLCSYRFMVDMAKSHKTRHMLEVDTSSQTHTHEFHGKRQRHEIKGQRSKSHRNLKIARQAPQDETADLTGGNATRRYTQSDITSHSSRVRVKGRSCNATCPLIKADPANLKVDSMKARS